MGTPIKRLAIANDVRIPGRAGQESTCTDCEGTRERSDTCISCCTLGRSTVRGESRYLPGEEVVRNMSYVPLVKFSVK